MSIRQLLIATAIVAAWTAGARLVGVQVGSEPISEFGFEDWALAYVVALVVAGVFVVAVVVVVGLTALIDHVFFSDDADSDKPKDS